MMKRFLAVMVALMCMCSAAFAEEPVTVDLQQWFNQEALPALQQLFPKAEENEQDETKWTVEDVEKLFADSTLITTVGTAVPEKNIDSAVITFTIESAGETVGEANALVMQAVNAVRSSLKEQGVADEQIRQTRYNVTPNKVYHNTKLTSDQVINGYIVEITLKVDILDLNIVGKVIDAAMISGAQTSPELTYECSDAVAAYYAALAKAAKLGMEKARLMAESCGLTLGELVSVVETSTMQDGTAVVEITYAAK